MNSKAAKIEEARLLEEKISRNLRNKLTRIYNASYPWQRKFISSTQNYDASMLMAANQVGKSRTGCLIDSYHLLGDYPDDWEGYRFSHAPLIWCLGYSGEKLRDLLQHKIFGRLKDRQIEGGYVPAERILDYKSMVGTSGGVKEVMVRHSSGGVSICQFWSYSQGQHALMGDVIDFYHIDEEPEDQEIYPQVLTRTINGDKGRGGRGILTFTPENGVTELVEKFRGDDAPGQYLQTATWKQCPHITPEKAEKILSKYPPYQRKMRSEGTPLQGTGLIYAHDTDKMEVEPFEIPDYWYLINGMDFGWDHPQAHIQLAWDADADIYYVTHAWKEKEKQPYEAWHVVKSWAEHVPVAWPADGLQTEKGSAKQQKEYYEEAGFNMLGVHAQWEDGGNGVEAGLMEINDLMKTGRLKIFSNLEDFSEEIRNYHRKATPNGGSKIVKVRDDLLDAFRYAYMMRHYAERKGDIYRMAEEDYYEQDYRETGRSAGTGY